MGYWPSKITCILNAILQMGWGIIGAIVAGQLFSAVDGGHLSIVCGCVIGALCIGLIATFGIAIIHVYERFAFRRPCLSHLPVTEDQANSKIDMLGYPK